MYVYMSLANKRNHRDTTKNKSNLLWTTMLINLTKTKRSERQSEIVMQLFHPVKELELPLNNITSRHLDIPALLAGLVAG